eukprot:SAG22_NODE_234_length_14360_cov_13.245915_17_plen_280_part_01
MDAAAAAWQYGAVLLPRAMVGTYGQQSTSGKREGARGGHLSGGRPARGCDRDALLGLAAAYAGAWRLCSSSYFLCSKRAIFRSQSRCPGPSQSVPPHLHLAAMPSRIDCHLHIWSGGEAPYPYFRERGGSPTFNVPPQDPAVAGAATTGTAEQLLAAQADCGVAGAMIVQPVHHGFDHSYVTAKMKEYPGKFKASLVIDPLLSPADAVAEIVKLHAAGWGGVRFKPALWRDPDHPFDDDTGRAVIAKCGELKMPVGILCSFGTHCEAIEKLCADFPATPF